MQVEGRVTALEDISRESIKSREQKVNEWKKQTDPEELIEHHQNKIIYAHCEHLRRSERYKGKDSKEMA
jgi:hypothetical protein